MKKAVLDAEEKDILESYERGEWRPIKNPKAEIKKLREYAKITYVAIKNCPSSVD